MNSGTVFWLDCAMWWKGDCTEQPAVMCLVVGQRRNSKTTFQSETFTKQSIKRLWSSLMVCCSSAFRILPKSLNLRKMLSRSMTWAICSTSDSNVKLVELWSFALSTVCTSTLTIHLPSFKHLTGEILSTTNGIQKMFSKSLSNPEA